MSLFSSSMGSNLCIRLLYVVILGDKGWWWLSFYCDIRAGWFSVYLVLKFVIESFYHKIYEIKFVIYFGFESKLYNAVHITHVNFQGFSCQIVPLKIINVSNL